jgi:hypothetical protein
MMDNNTLQALTMLANKLGTTAEYLWGVLLRQAPITGAINLVMMTVWVVAVLLLLRWVRIKTRVPPKTEDEPYPRAEWDGDGAFFAWAASIVFATMVVVIVGLELPKAVVALVNPEYWALRQILK